MRTARWMAVAVARAGVLRPRQCARSFTASSSRYISDEEPKESAPLEQAEQVKEGEAATSNPYEGLLSGPDAFATVESPSRPRTRSSWVTEQFDALSAPPQRGNRANADTAEAAQVDAFGRKKNSVSRDVLFADANADRATGSKNAYMPNTDDELDAEFRKNRTYSKRKAYDRTPLTEQESKAFISLLDKALGDAPSSSSEDRSGASAETVMPFGAYTTFLSDAGTPSGSKSLLQSFANRNRLQRFEDTRAARAKRFAREGLAAQISHAELEAGVDEAREDIALCENLTDLLTFARRQIWGLEAPPSSAKEEDATTPHQPKYGKQTPFYAPVLHLLFLTIRDRYRAPNTALSIPRITKSLGVESYVLGMTSTLCHDMLKTQWGWLGDMHAVVETLKEARNTGILGYGKATSRTAERRADKLDSMVSPIGRTSSASFSHGTKEDEAIRETVDRITNEVRQHILDQVSSSNSTQPKDSVDYNSSSGPVSLVNAPAASSRKAMDAIGFGVSPAASSASLADNASLNWAQKLVLEQARQATKLAGRPARHVLNAYFERRDRRAPWEDRGDSNHDRPFAP